MRQAPTKEALKYRADELQAALDQLPQYDKATLTTKINAANAAIASENAMGTAYPHYFELIGVLRQHALNREKPLPAFLSKPDTPSDDLESLSTQIETILNKSVSDDEKALLLETATTYMEDQCATIQSQKVLPHSLVNGLTQGIIERSTNLRARYKQDYEERHGETISNWKHAQHDNISTRLNHLGALSYLPVIGKVYTELQQVHANIGALPENSTPEQREVQRNKLADLEKRSAVLIDLKTSIDKLQSHPRLGLLALRSNTDETNYINGITHSINESLRRGESFATPLDYMKTLNKLADDLNKLSKKLKTFQFTHTPGEKKEVGQLKEEVEALRKTVKRQLFHNRLYDELAMYLTGTAHKANAHALLHTMTGLNRHNKEDFTKPFTLHETKVNISFFKLAHSATYYTKDMNGKRIETSPRYTVNKDDNDYEQLKKLDGKKIELTGEQWQQFIKAYNKENQGKREVTFSNDLLDKIRNTISGNKTIIGRDLEQNGKPSNEVMKHFMNEAAKFALEEKRKELKTHSISATAQTSTPATNPTGEISATANTTPPTIDTANNAPSIGAGGP